MPESLGILPGISRTRRDLFHYKEPLKRAHQSPLTDVPKQVGSGAVAICVRPNAVSLAASHFEGPGLSQCTAGERAEFIIQVAGSIADAVHKRATAIMFITCTACCPLDWCLTGALLREAELIPASVCECQGRPLLPSPF